MLNSIIAFYLLLVQARFKFIGKVSIVLLIFFTLQGEVVQRYIDLFQGKLEHRSSVPPETAKRHQLIKLQCFTQKISPISLPAGTQFAFQTPVKILTSKIYLINDISFIDNCSISYPQLRGPPCLNS